MNIGGLATMTLLDYPGKVAATIFTNACNFKCPFCHNGELVLNKHITNNAFPEDEVLAFLKKRKHLLDAVCITGGEPTLQADLAEFICKLKSLGYLVKLDTNGYKPNAIKGLIEGHLIDYIAMDFKASFDNYPLATGIKNLDILPIKESIQLILDSDIDYEFRTTVVKGIHTADELLTMADTLSTAKQYFLQSYEDSDRIIGKLEASCQYSAFSRDELIHILDVCKKKNPNIMLRGIDSH